jgi:hypothetical protein
MKHNNVRISSRRGRPKSEIHPPEAGKNSKYKCSNAQNENPRAYSFGHWNFGHWNLFRASDFEFADPDSFSKL